MKKRKRIGRGPGSGNGTTAGMGNNGSNARAGAQYKIGFEGGQMPLTRKLPKRGFTNIYKVEYQVVNLSDIDRKATGNQMLDPVSMKTLRLIANDSKRVKVLGDGTLSVPVTIKAHAFSASALEKIKQANGKAEVIKK